MDEPLSLNLYAYCHNNPVVYYDPTGHALWKLENLVEQAGGEIKVYENEGYFLVKANKKTNLYSKDTFFMYDGSYIVDDRLFKLEFNYHIKTFDRKTKLKLDSSKNDIIPISTSKEANYKKYGKFTPEDLLKTTTFYKYSRTMQNYLYSAVEEYGAFGYYYALANVGRLNAILEDGVISTKEAYLLGLSVDGAALLEFTYRAESYGMHTMDFEMMAHDDKMNQLRAYQGFVALTVAANTSNAYKTHVKDPDHRLENGRVYKETTSPKGYISNANGTWTSIKGTSKTSVLDNANFAQKTYSSTFSKDGIKIYSDLAGKPINTVIA